MKKNCSHLQIDLFAKLEIADKANVFLRAFSLVFTREQKKPSALSNLEVMEFQRERHKWLALKRSSTKKKKEKKIVS